MSIAAIRLGAAGTIVCVGALLAGCGHPQEVIQSGTVGSNAQVGDVLLRNVYVENPPQASYPGGGDAAVRLTLINQASRPDTLVSVRSDVARSVDILTDMDCNGSPESASILSLPARVDTSSPPNAPGPNDAGYALRLVDLKTGVLQGSSVPIVFTFRNAGSITVPAPVEAAQPAPSQPAWICSR